MLIDSEDVKSFSNKYSSNEKEILILTGDKSGGAAKLSKSWEAIQYFLAYIDLETNELKTGDGRICWLLTEEDCMSHGTGFPYDFETGTIYRLQVRELIDKTVPEGGLASAYNKFMLVKVVEKQVQNDELLSVLKEYRAPVKIIDKELGEFTLDKDYGLFQGNLKWLHGEISVSLAADEDNKRSCNGAIEILRSMVNRQIQKDIEFRTYAAEELTDLANEWSQDEDVKITMSDFITKINLSALDISHEGEFTAYYSDGDMFYGHTIIVSGNITTGIDEATIAG